MISVEEAQRQILARIGPPLSTEHVPLTHAWQRVLASEVAADCDIPPFTNTSMDGFAVVASDTSEAGANAPVRLEVVSTIAAGHPSQTILAPGQCMRIMTGAPLPVGADAVVQVEWTHSDPLDPAYVLIERSVHSGQNVRHQGEDMKKGAAILTPGTRLTAANVGILATVGCDPVTVYSRPRVMIVSTGDELVEPHLPLRAGAIRNSNSFAIAAAVQAAGGIPTILPIAKDTRSDIRERLDAAQEQGDLIISSGGVSVGDYDFVKSVVQENGELAFWRVNMKPGKPVTFGHYRNTPFIGLPGNPVSALVTFELFVRPVLRVWQGDQAWRRRHLNLPLAQSFEEISDRRHYVRCRLIDRQGELLIDPHSKQGSGIQTSWADVQALMIVPEFTGPYETGTYMPAMIID